MKIKIRHFLVELEDLREKSSYSGDVYKKATIIKNELRELISLIEQEESYNN